MKSLLGFSWRRACGSVDQTVENGRPPNPGFPNRGSSGALRLCGLSSVPRISDATVTGSGSAVTFLFNCSLLPHSSTVQFCIDLLFCAPKKRLSLSSSFENSLISYVPDQSWFWLFLSKCTCSFPSLPDYTGRDLRYAHGAEP